MNRLVHACVVAACVCSPAIARAQHDDTTRAVAFDTVVGVQDYFDDDGAWKTQLIVDPFTSVEVAPGLQASFRPLFWRSMMGDWDAYVVHASLRYEFTTRNRWRIEAGKFTSPIGLGMTENRANVNDGLIWWHRGYYSPLPSMGSSAAPHALISSIYPYGVQVNTSSDRWDARVALIDRAPADFFHTEDRPHRANGVIGGGVTLRQGLRLGAATARGRSGDATRSDPYTLVNVEGEFAFDYTRISGEWTHDTFDTPAGERDARGATLQVRQTLTPRIFVHTRGTAITSPVPAGAAGDVVDRTSWYVDTTAGYLVNPDTSVRVGHSAVRRWSAGAVDHQVGVSLVWSRRWW